MVEEVLADQERRGTDMKEEIVLKPIYKKEEEYKKKLL